MDHNEDPLVKAGGLPAMIGCFLKNNKDAYKSFRNHQKSKRAEPSEEKQSKKSDKKDKKRDSKLAGKRHSTGSIADEEIQPKKKRARISSVASTEGPLTRRKSNDAAEIGEELLKA